MTIAGEIMSRPLLAMDGGCRVDEAIRFAREHGIEHVLVAEGEDVVGVVALDSLRAAPSADEIRSHAGCLVEMVPVSASLHEVAERLQLSREGCVPVVAGGLLLGIVTRTDLAQATPSP